MVPYKRFSEEVDILEPQIKVVKFFKTVFQQNKGECELIKCFLEELSARAKHKPDEEFCDFKKWFSGEYKQVPKPTSQQAPA